MGNLGIGNGSMATFGDPDSLPSNYSDNNFQAGDVSQEPLDPVRELNLNVATPVDGREQHDGRGNVTTKLRITPLRHRQSTGTAVSSSVFNAAVER